MKNAMVNNRHTRAPKATALAPVLAGALVLAGCTLGDDVGADDVGENAPDVDLDGVELTVGSKEFTEQLILCELTAQVLAAHNATITRSCGMTGSDTTRRALESGEIDMYWEYTGTAWISYMNNTDPIDDEAEQYEAVAEADESENQIIWLEPAPYNSTYAIGMSRELGESLGVTTLSEYAELTEEDPEEAALCVGPEFSSRNDGLPGLQDAYGFELPSDNLSTMTDGAIPQAVSDQVECNFGMMTEVDGRIPALDLSVLEDDQAFFPVYNPAVTIQEDVIEADPEIADVLAGISEALDTEEIQRLNEMVDVDGLEADDSASDWLSENGLIG